MFFKGNRVAFAFDKSATGTVTSSRKTVVHVLWNETGIETPVDPAELIHCPAPKKNDRSALAKESATANETNHKKEDDSMNQSNAEQIQPPAGFTLTQSADGDFNHYAGPSANSGALTVEALWEPVFGIEYHITNNRHFDNGVFSHTEMSVLSQLVSEVLEAVEKAGSTANTAHRDQNGGAKNG